MSASSFLTKLKRLATEVVAGPERLIVHAVEALLEKPDDEFLMNELLHMMKQDSHAFLAAVQKHFSVTPTTMLKPSLDSFPCGTAKKWQNYVGTQVAEPFEIACPRSLAELQQVLAKASAMGWPVRAAGSHHSWSDAALTDGIAIETHGLAEPPAPADRNLLKDTVPDPERLYRVSGGMTIQNLNTALNDRGMALINMGGYDGQTLAGVISTSTHGSGIKLGAFPSFVEALIVINADGEILQIEPANGITDPAKFAAGGGVGRLVQDDKTFNASVVGMGCLGIIYAVILRVRTQYWLSETRTKHKWSELREALRAGQYLQDYRHVEVIVNPHVVDGDRTCLLTLRREVPPPTGTTPDKPFRDLFAELLASLGGAGDVLAALFHTFPALTPKLVESAIHNLEDPNEYVAMSYKMLNIGAANGFPAVCSEIGVNVDVHVDAVDAVLAVAAQARTEGAYHSGVIAMRYVAQSPGFLSTQPVETCMIELPMLRGVFGSDSLPWRYEKVLTEKFRGRPHWGQRNFLTGSHAMLERIYGPQNVEQWLDVFRQFNPKGQFYSTFTDRLGFSSHGPS